MPNNPLEVKTPINLDFDEFFSVLRRPLPRLSNVGEIGCTDGMWCGVQSRMMAPVREPETEEILRELGGINMNGKRFVDPKEVEKVIIRTKDGCEFEGSVERSEYMPGPFGRAGYSYLTVKTVAPEKVGKYGIKRVVFNNPATIVFWDDGTKTVVYCQDNVKKVKKTVDGVETEVLKPQKADTYSAEVGLAMALVKKHYGNGSNYNNIFRKFIPGMKEREKEERKAEKARKKAAKREGKTND